MATVELLVAAASVAAALAAVAATPATVAGQAGLMEAARGVATDRCCTHGTYSGNN